MSKFILWGVGVLAVLALAGGAWYWSGHFTPNVPSVAGPSASTTDQTNGSAPGAASGAQNSGTASASGSGSYDADLNSIDSQMSGFSSDTASMDAGMNDQQIQQSSL